MTRVRGCRARRVSRGLSGPRALLASGLFDIVISETLWRSEEGHRLPMPVGKESLCGSRTPSGERSRKHCAETMSSLGGAPRSPSGSVTSWWLMPARSSESRSPARLYGPRPEVPPIGNGGVLPKPFAGQRLADANVEARVRILPPVTARSSLSTEPVHSSRKRASSNRQDEPPSGADKAERPRDATLGREDPSLLSNRKGVSDVNGSENESITRAGHEPSRAGRGRASRLLRPR